MELDYYEIPRIVLKVDNSIRFVGLVDKLGYITRKQHRGETPELIMSEEDNERYALVMTMRRRANFPWREKVGRTQYFLWRSEKLVQVAIPLTADHLVLVYFDSKVGTNYDRIILEKILPLISKYL